MLNYNPLHQAFLQLLRPRWGGHRREYALRPPRLAPSSRSGAAGWLAALGSAFSALRVPRFRQFFVGQSVSLMGSWIENVALGWLVYRLTGSMWLLGLVGFLGQIPTLFLTPIAGVFADRYNRRLVLLGLQCVPMMLSLTMAALIFTGYIAVWHIVVAALINGCVLAFDTPFRHAFLFDLVGERRYLANAVAMNSTMVNTARFLGPLLGGVLIASVGEAWCFAINSGSYVAIIVALGLMRVPPAPRPARATNVWTALTEGFRYAMAFRPIRDLLALVSAISLFAMPLQVFLPAFAKSVLQGEATYLGMLTGAIGAGALTGAFYLATRKSVVHFPLQIYVFTLIMSVGLIAFSQSWTIWLAVPLLYFTGMGLIAIFSSTNTYLQAIVNDGMRGRVIALYGMTFMGITPLGSLMLGGIAKAIGLPMTLLGCGAVCLAIALVYRHRIVRIVRQSHLGRDMLA